MNVPYLDLQTQYRSIKDEIRIATDLVLDNAQYVSGPAVHAFEAAFARYVGAEHCVAVGSGTDSLHVALLAAGVGPGDEVITQANTFIATVEAIVYTGARAVLVDIAPPTYTIDVDAVAAAITARTKAIIPVHLFGQPADLAPLRALAEKHGLALIEDASQAHGAEYRGERIGTRAVATWSFYPGKNLGAFGEAGAVTCDDDALAKRMRVLVDHGSSRKYEHEIVGYNYRMDGFQGAVLGVKLRHLDAWTQGRRRAAARYDELLRGFEKPTVPADVRSSWHIYPVFVDDRDRVREQLNAAGIGSNVHYPIPCHLQAGYGFLGYREGAFPRSEALARRELSLPMYAELTDDQLGTVARALAEATCAVA
jgi:dTDP-4-amino-4,6-dideoxygalactose transaminase